MTPHASPTVDLTLHCVEEGVEDDNPLHGYHIVESMPVFPAFWAMRRTLFWWRNFAVFCQEDAMKTPPSSHAEECGIDIVQGWVIRSSVWTSL